MARPKKKQNSASPDKSNPAPTALPVLPAVRKPRWVWRIAALVLAPLLAFAFLEAALHLANYGYPTKFFLHSKVQGQSVLIENEKFGWQFFGPDLARTPRPMAIPLIKPTNTFRIFVFGESAAFGDPLPDFGLPRVLETLLSARYPEAHFEVVNVAMTAINSHVILPIARECAGQNGDLWVIYMGNNEVVGPYGGGTVFGPQAPSLPLIHAIRNAKSTRTGELFSELASRSGGRQSNLPEWSGMSMFLRQQVRHDDPRMARVYSNFDSNLSDILKLGRDHQAKIVVSTVASNLKDCAPFGSQHRANLSASETGQWEQIYQEAIQGALTSNALKTIDLFQKAAQIDDHYAELQFRWGQCCLTLGRDQEARNHFTLARDYDTLRFRADSRINDIIRKAATGREKDGILLADAQQMLAAESPHGLVGENLLYEHVHLSFEGNHRLARCLAEQVAKLLPLNVTRGADSKQSWIEPADCARRMAWTEWDQHRAAKILLMRINDPPFVTQFDQAEHFQRLQKWMEHLLPSLGPEGLHRASKVYEEAVKERPDDWVLQYNLAQLKQQLGAFNEAESLFRHVTELLPHYSMAFLKLGLLEIQRSRPQEAISYLDAVLRLKPDSVSAMNGLALALSALGRKEAALQEYEKALRIKPDMVETHLNLGTALAAMGNPEGAREHFRRANESKMEKSGTYARLGQMCFLQGWTNEAQANFISALRLDPTDSMAHYWLARVLDAMQRQTEAQRHFHEAVRLNPELPEPRLGLGIALFRQGKNEESAAQFAEAARLAPNLIEAHFNLGLVLLRQQKRSEAAAQFTEVLRIDPKNATARKYMTELSPR